MELAKIREGVSFGRVDEIHSDSGSSEESSSEGGSSIRSSSVGASSVSSVGAPSVGVSSIGGSSLRRPSVGYISPPPPSSDGSASASVNSWRSWIPTTTSYLQSKASWGLSYGSHMFGNGRNLLARHIATPEYKSLHFPSSANPNSTTPSSSPVSTPPSSIPSKPDTASGLSSNTEFSNQSNSKSYDSHYHFKDCRFKVTIPSSNSNSVVPSQQYSIPFSGDIKISNPSSTGQSDFQSTSNTPSISASSKIVFKPLEKWENKAVQSYAPHSGFNPADTAPQTQSKTDAFWKSITGILKRSPPPSTGFAPTSKSSNTNTGIQVPPIEATRWWPRDEHDHIFENHVNSTADDTDDSRIKIDIDFDELGRKIGNLVSEYTQSAISRSFSNALSNMTPDQKSKINAINVNFNYPTSNNNSSTTPQTASSDGVQYIHNHVFEKVRNTGLWGAA